MVERTAEVIVLGAGVMGCSAAYWLSGEGYQVLLLEKESLAVGASGMSAAMWLAGGRGDQAEGADPLAELSRLGFQLHHSLADTLPAESGVDYGYRENPTIYPAFTEDEAAQVRGRLAAVHGDDPSARWLEGKALREVEPRLNPQALGGLVCRQAQVIAGRFVLALAQAAERRGAQLRNAAVAGLTRSADRVTGVRLRDGRVLGAERVVLAMGPWTQEAEAWLGMRAPIYPVRGQILELRLPDPQLQASISYGGGYVVHKADGTTLAGTTEEHESGFVNETTPQGLEAIMDGALQMAPSLMDAQLMNRVSGLRPCCEDRLPMIGAVPGWEGVYLTAGHFRNGMVQSV
ncbi:MAG: FAD-binding oxidoreductase, partial [Chloroflexi bacterium]|nr:FAD-binding oxidoreductase [Chloroflexota bacterium]